MSDPARHRDREARDIERCTFFGKIQSTYTQAERLLVDKWFEIMDERIEMLPPRTRTKEGPQPRRGRIVLEIAI